jgi:hypothetical protein
MTFSIILTVFFVLFVSTLVAFFYFRPGYYHRKTLKNMQEIRDILGELGSVEGLRVLDLCVEIYHQIRIQKKTGQDLQALGSYYKECYSSAVTSDFPTTDIVWTLHTLEVSFYKTLTALHMEAIKIQRAQLKSTLEELDIGLDRVNVDISELSHDT